MIGDSLFKCYRLVIPSIALVFLLISVLAAESDNYTVKIAHEKFLGNYLVNQSGFTLYYFQNDSKTSGTNACYNECAILWPPFHVSRLFLPDDLKLIDFGEITRKDGSKQTTFKSWPLYLYSRDSEPGDALGKGKEFWHIVIPEDQPQMI